MFADDTDPETSESSTEETEEEVEADVDATEEADEEEAEGPLLAKGKKGEGWEANERRRNKVYAGYKKGQQYEQLGSPQEIADKLTRLEGIEAKIDRLEDKGKGDTTESDELKAQRTEIRKKMREVEPGLESE